MRIYGYVPAPMILVLVIIPILGCPRRQSLFNVQREIHRFSEWANLAGMLYSGRYSDRFGFLQMIRTKRDDEIAGLEG